ncbi:MAG: O-antigen ligase family protein, partial [Cyclobacteriaceae bacterium]
MQSLKDQSISLKFKQPLFLGGLIIISLLVAFGIAQLGIAFGVVFILLLLAIPLFLISLLNPQNGFLILTVYGYFLFLIGRLSPVDIPTGIGIEVVSSILFVGLLVKEFKVVGDRWRLFKNPVTYLLLVSETYNLVQGANPNSVSIAGWIVSLRGIVFTLILYFIVIKVFTDFNYVKRFTQLWLFLAVLAGLYGIYQEIFGYSDFEWRAIYANPKTFNLISVWSGIRKFSFLSDVAAFGLLMAFGGIFTTIMILGPYKPHIKVVLLICTLIMFAGMTYSGTRSATAMIPVGIVFYILLSLNNKVTIVFLGVSVIIFCAILFGPFYSPSIQRLKSTFSPSEDPSMQVRDRNRTAIQPYIYSHPIGGGVFTTNDIGHVYSPGHRLAGFQTDSGYLKTALEKGWIGLIIQLALYSVIMAIGISNYFKVRDPEIKIYYAAYMASFFALTVA